METCKNQMKLKFLIIHSSIFKGIRLVDEGNDMY